MKRLIEVTRNDIRDGLRYDCQLCPVARAIQRHLKPGLNLTVCSVAARLRWFRNPEPVVVLALPEVVSRFISSFDFGDRPRSHEKPFSFELDIPDEFLALEGQS